VIDKASSIYPIEEGAEASKSDCEGEEEFLSRQQAKLKARRKNGTLEEENHIDKNHSDAPFSEIRLASKLHEPDLQYHSIFHSPFTATSISMIAIGNKGSSTPCARHCQLRTAISNPHLASLHSAKVGPARIIEEKTQDDGTADLSEKLVAELLRSKSQMKMLPSDRWEGENGDGKRTIQRSATSSSFITSNLRRSTNHIYKKLKRARRNWPSESVGGLPIAAIKHFNPEKSPMREDRLRRVASGESDSSGFNAIQRVLRDFVLIKELKLGRKRTIRIADLPVEFEKLRCSQIVKRHKVWSRGKTVES